jgi:hypothetical protein
VPNSFEGLPNPGGSEQNQQQYVNIREVPGSGGKLFVGDVANKQEIEGRVRTCYLIPDGEGGYRPPTYEELDKILEEIKGNKKKNQK